MYFRSVVAVMVFSVSVSAAPALRYSTFIGGSLGEVPTAIASDRLGNVIVVGTTDSTDFMGTATPPGQSNAFVVKLDAAGRVVFQKVFGGSAADVALGVTTDLDGNVYVVGWTVSPNFPTTSNAPFAAGGSSSIDAFLMKLDPAGTVLYSTLFGGTSNDQANAVATDSSGNVYVAGETLSTNIPLKNSQQTDPSPQRITGFLFKLDASGTTLQYSTYIGGSGNDQALAVDADREGNAWVAGVTSSTDFPTLNPLQSQLGGGRDAFVARYNPAGIRTFSTLLGGSGDDIGMDLEAEESGVFLCGSTKSSNFPTKGSLLATRPAAESGFAARLTLAGELVYSTFLGGSGTAAALSTGANGRGEQFVFLTVSSSDVPTKDALQPAFRPDTDGFLMQLDATGTQLLFGSYFGGDAVEIPHAMTMTPGGVAITGLTFASGFPILNAVRPTITGTFHDGYVASILLEPLKRRAVRP